MIITADDVRTHLGGLDRYVDQLGAEQAARAYAERIAAAEAWFQRTTRVRLEPTLIVTYPEEGQEYDLADDAYTLHGAAPRVLSASSRGGARHRDNPSQPEFGEATRLLPSRPPGSA